MSSLGSSEAFEASPSSDSLAVVVSSLAFCVALSFSVAFSFLRIFFSLINWLDEEDEESESSISFLEAQEANESALRKMSLINALDILMKACRI